MIRVLIFLVGLQFLTLFTFSQSYEEYSNESSIKLFMSRIVYERMNFYEFQIKQEGDSLSSEEQGGISVYREKFYNKPDWDPDSIEKYLLESNWGDCNTQVFQPLLKSLRSQKNSGEFRFDTFLKANLGDKFMNSEMYHSVVKDYEIAVPILDADLPEASIPLEIKDSKRFSNSIKIPERSLLGNLFFGLLLILFGSMLTVAYSQVNRMQKKRRSKHSGSDIRQKSNTMSSQEIQWANSRLRSENSKLNEENQELRGKVHELSDKVDRLEAVFKSEELVEVADSQSILESDSNQLTYFEYYEGHEDGSFDQTTAMKNDGPRALFKIEVEGRKGKLFLLVGRMDSILISNKDVLLEDVCTISTAKNSKGDKLAHINPGKVILQGNNWSVVEKAEIEIR